jgi:pimeloyl-ACP methyl ester carboxylesterase
MPTTKPTAILIVHGGYFLPPAWEPFMEDLTKAGFTVRCPRLPTCGDERPPKALLEQDVAAVREAATELINARHTVSVLAHSYGGIVATEAITSDFYVTAGRSGGVVSIIYLCAWLVQAGQTAAFLIEKYGLQTGVDLGNNGDGTVFAKNAPESFYSDIGPLRAEELAKSNVTHNWGAVAGALTAAPWKDLPSTYIYCTQDRGLFLPFQEGMVRDAIEASGTTNLKTVTLDSGHCPFLSKSQELLQLIENIVIGEASA